MEDSNQSTTGNVQGAETNGANGQRNPYPLQQGTRTVSYNSHPMVTEDDGHTMGVTSWIRDEAWTCLAIVFTFWFLVCMITIVGVYGSVTLILGPHSSILIKPNSYLVEYIQVEDLNEGPILVYGFYKEPPLDVVITWSDIHNVNLQSSTHKDWIYFLNEGSLINISYSVNSTNMVSSLIFVIADGYEGLNEWLEEPSHPNTTLSWQLIQGNGMIQQDIFTSSSYYVALGNLNEEAAVVQLQMRLRSLIYNTSKAYEKCGFTQGKYCRVKVAFGGGDSAVLTSPASKPGRAVNEWRVKLSYGPRWITYLAGIGGMTALVLASTYFLSYCSCMNETEHETRRLHLGGEVMRSQTTPLLLNKEDDLSSWGSSYDSLSQGDEDPEDQLPALTEGKSGKDGENNHRRLCVICFDAPRDCFFLPCGHCAACFACATRIAEAAGTCPICRRLMRKIRKIFTV